MKLRNSILVASLAVTACRSHDRGPAEAPETDDDVEVQGREEKTFTLGSSHDEVRAAMGAPTGVQHVIHEMWSYDFSGVDFDAAGKVIAWRQGDRHLATRLAPHDPKRYAAAKARGTWSIGSTTDDVLAVQGVPTAIHRVIHDTWMYEFSEIEFDDAGKVLEYRQGDVRLRVE